MPTVAVRLIGCALSAMLLTGCDSSDTGAKDASAAPAIVRIKPEDAGAVRAIADAQHLDYREDVSRTGEALFRFMLDDDGARFLANIPPEMFALTGVVTNPPPTSFVEPAATAPQPDAAN